MNSESTVEKDKKDYSSPKLVEYGSIQQLTKAGTGGRSEAITPPEDDPADYMFP